MNKQEFQQKIKDMKPPKFFNAITLSEAYKAGFEEAKGNALCDSCFLNEPEKPVVPKYVADMIVKRKKQGDSLLTTLVNLGVFGDAQRWIRNGDNSDTFAKAWLFGYEVEHEQQYVVAIPDDERNKFIQLWKNRKGKLLFNFEDKIRYGKVHLLTEKEIKQKDERLWQFAEAVKE